MFSNVQVNISTIPSGLNMHGINLNVSKNHDKNAVF